MYDKATIEHVQPDLKALITQIYEKAFRPNLLPEEQRALSDVSFDTPFVGDPVLGYYSNYKTRVITMPAISLLFFQDLCTAYAWLYEKKYRLETVEEYLTMLKYNSPQAFGGRYQPPLKALGIPRDASDDPNVKDLSRRFRNSGLAFILAHELGHVRFQHKSYNEVPVAVSQANEEQADQFALELMRRVPNLPMGAMLFFQSAVYYFENRADFASYNQWTNYVATVARHPITTERLKVLSERVDTLASSLARRQPNDAETLHFIGSHFAEFAQFLSDPHLQQTMKLKAEQSSPSSLAPRR